MDKYDTGNDHYCYPGTSVLKNKLGITDGQILEDAEREITKSAMAYRIHYVGPPYHLDYLKGIHAALFSELYPWAGQIRDVDIAKGGTRFCTASRIVPETEKLFRHLQNDDYLTAVSGAGFMEKLAEYYAEFNMIHPFREGNGRVQRVFFAHLAAYNGYALDWSSISQDEWLQANIDGFHVRYQRLATIFSRVVTQA